MLKILYGEGLISYGTNPIVVKYTIKYVQTQHNTFIINYMYLNLLSDSRSNMSFSLKLGLPYYLHWIILLFQACMCSHSVLQSIVRQIFKNDPGVANYIMLVRISSIGCFEKNCSVDLWEDQCIFLTFVLSTTIYDLLLIDILKKNLSNQHTQYSLIYIH